MDVFAKWIRINKEAHQSRGLTGMVPWVTTGFDGVLEPPQVLAQVVHMLAGGCTGFNLFCSAADGDWDSWANMLSFSRAVELVLPYEAIIADGSVAYEAVVQAASSNVLAVSAMTHEQRYLIALSARDGSAPMQVALNASASPQEYELVDALSGKATPLPKAGRDLLQFSVQQRQGEEFALVVVQPKRAAAYEYW